MRDGVNDPTWATVRVRFAPGFELQGKERTRAYLADQADRLDELGAMLVLEGSVGGVETRDPTTFGNDSERAELWVYTTPAAVDTVVHRARELATTMGLRLRFDTQVREDDDWRDAWKQFYAPMVLGQRALLVRPSWIERREDDPTCELILDPGRAFGTGLHATTRLCLDRVCALFEAGVKPSSVLDLGCGSGILALAAARLVVQATRIVAADVDPEATATTAENAAHNALTDRVDVITGGLDAVPEGESFDLVLANIRPEVLVPVAPSLAQRLRADARLTISGILDEESDAVLEHYRAAGYVLDERDGGGRRTLESWTAFDLRFER
jgi:ribosomal protein L11 methyltransferase